MTSASPIYEVNDQQNVFGTMYSTMFDAMIGLDINVVEPLNSVLSQSFSKTTLALVCILTIVVCDYVIHALLIIGKFKFHHPLTYLFKLLNMLPGINAFMNRGMQ